MTSMKPEVIRYRHIRNIKECVENLKSMGESRFGKEWMGFIKETTFIHSEGFITRKIEPIKGSPAAEFRKAIEKAGLVGRKIFEDDKAEIRVTGDVPKQEGVKDGS